MIEVSSDLDTILRKHARITYPLDKDWKKKAVEFCAERLGDIQAFRALGLDAIKDPERRKMIAGLLNVEGNENVDPDEYGFNVWLLNECIGDTRVTDRIFMRCESCLKVRTNRGMAKGPCKCGSTRMRQGPPQMETQKVLARLVQGY